MTLIDTAARPGHCETTPGHTSRTVTYWRVRYEAHGSAGYVTTPLDSLGAVRSQVAFLVESQGAVGVRVVEYTLTECAREVGPAEITRDGVR